MDKQIKEVFKNGFYCIEPCPEIKELLAELKRKEQECEELNEELYYWVNGEYCDNKCNVVKELDQLKAENEELKEYIKHLHNLCGNETDKQYEYKQTLIEIKFWARELLKRTGQVVPNEIKQILQKISECEGNDVKLC